jgi:hypothetical protein
MARKVLQPEAIIAAAFDIRRFDAPGLLMCSRLTPFDLADVHSLRNAM